MFLPHFLFDATSKGPVDGSQRSVQEKEGGAQLLKKKKTLKEQSNVLRIGRKASCDGDHFQSLLRCAKFSPCE